MGIFNDILFQETTAWRLHVDEDGNITDSRFDSKKPTVQKRYALNQRMANICKQFSQKYHPQEIVDMCTKIHEWKWAGFSHLKDNLQNLKGDFTARDNDSWLPEFLLNIVRMIRMAVARIFGCCKNEEDAYKFSKINLDYLFSQMQRYGLNLRPGEFEKCKYIHTATGFPFSFHIDVTILARLELGLLNKYVFKLGGYDFILRFDQNQDRFTISVDKYFLKTESLTATSQSLSIGAYMASPLQAMPGKDFNIPLEPGMQYVFKDFREPTSIQIVKKV